MKIVKQFDDFDFFNKVYEGPNDPNRDYWRWGLGDDGELYWQRSEEPFAGKWMLVGNRNSVGISNVSLDVMVRIVKEFGKLLVWL